ncbi:hypothetical protein OG689_11030 [Kitasatospora sp. NBC_00240]|uniref:hypothetical protein n=1 Tax=Kitasatospora sp. NBC_00240 TaxID=2903567 RepID=UPI00224CA720|nr:hypothetical protein [Kitasatospora sp. NBC_00240]MCX5209818.1 hypothetical protein [Kitasatospora sp. NBC_00240]
MPTPVTFAPAKQFLGMAVEATQGTPVAMVFTQLVNSLKPKDVPKFLEDKSWRGSMGTESFAQIAGVKASSFDLGGPVYGDGLPFFLRNIMGDLAVTGTPTGSGATTLGSQAVAGAVTMSTVASIPAGTLVQVGTGATAEVVTTGTPTGSGPYNIPIATPSTGLVYTHASAQAVTPVTGPYTYAFSLLNSGSGQPPSHTLTHYLGPTATSGARQYPGTCLGELGLKFNAESELLTWTGKAQGFPSVALGSAPTANPTATLPVAGWQTKVGIGGPASGGTLVSTVSDGEITMKRELGVYYTATGVQTPYVIQRGGLSVEGKLNFGAVADESPLLYMLNNTQPVLQIVTTNGLAGNALITVQVDIQVAAFISSEAETGKTAVGYQNGFKAVFNTTNAGGSGGMSPIRITVTNNVAPNTY